MAIKTTIIFLLLLKLHSSSAQTWIRAGYWWSGSKFPIPISNINSTLFTHLIYSSAALNSSTYQLSFSSSDERHFSTFTHTVQQKNPSIVTLLSIGGRNTNNSVFSAMVSQASYRKSFIESSIKTARLYGFHGLDFSWLSPNTSSDMANMGTLFDEWRAALNSRVQSFGCLGRDLAETIRSRRPPRRELGPLQAYTPEEQFSAENVEISDETKRDRREIEISGRIERDFVQFVREHLFAHVILQKAV